MHSPGIDLSLVFHALSDPTRRGVLERLGHGPASVSELAEPYGISLPTFVQHLNVLEASGLVRSEKNGRVRTCRLVPQTFGSAESWMAEQRALWEKRLDGLDNYLIALHTKEKNHGKRKK